MGITVVSAAASSFSPTSISASGNEVATDGVAGAFSMLFDSKISSKSLKPVPDVLGDPKNVSKKGKDLPGNASAASDPLLDLIALAQSMMPGVHPAPDAKNASDLPAAQKLDGDGDGDVLSEVSSDSGSKTDLLKLPSSSGLGQAMSADGHADGHADGQPLLKLSDQGADARLSKLLDGAVEPTSPKEKAASSFQDALQDLPFGGVKEEPKGANGTSISGTASPTVSQLVATTQQSVHATKASAENTFQVGTPLSDSAWAKDAGKQIMMMMGRKLDSAQLQVTPANMGPVEVSLKINQDSVNVLFMASSQQTRDSLEQHLPKLASMLAENGLQLGGAQVSSGDQNNQSAQQQFNFANQNNPQPEGSPSFSDIADGRVVLPQGTEPTEAPLVRQISVDDGRVSTYA